MDVGVERRADGTILLRSTQRLGPYPRCITERLLHWAREAPQRRFIAQRDETGAWRTLTYAQTLARVRAIGLALLERGLSAERPLAILSDNDIEHALLALAAMHVGVPYVPVSSAYSLVSTDHAKLRYVMDLVTPGLVFASDRGKFARAIQAAVPAGIEAIFNSTLDKFEIETPSGAVDEAHARVGPDTIAKFLLTSGSTGQPKAVVNTQRMLCANQQMLAQALPSLRSSPPVLVDWLPWNHTAGGNHNFGIVLYNGGTLYIDDGKPVPGLIQRTVRNLREIAPTAYFNVPRGYEALLPYLRSDAALRNSFFSRLGLLQYAAAVLPQPVWKAYEDLALESTGKPLLWITGYGATETAPFAMCTHRGAARAGTVGLPVDGLELKLVPSGDKLEARFRGPSIAPGYWRQPDLTRAAFDEEGFYRSGDAMRFADPAQPQSGLVFDGRTAEDFKLTTGTWVSVGALRGRIASAGSPYVQDAVITGHDRGEVGALIFPNLQACNGFDAAALRGIFQDVVDRLAGDSTGSSTRIARALVLEQPPSLDAGEITDKGSINQRAVLKVRATLVEELYAEPPGARVVIATPCRISGAARL
jgi:feruloyl-CoA synthase